MLNFNLSMPALHWASRVSSPVEFHAELAAKGIVPEGDMLPAASLAPPCTDECNDGADDLLLKKIRPKYTEVEATSVPPRPSYYSYERPAHTSGTRNHSRPITIWPTSDIHLQTRKGNTLVRAPEIDDSNEDFQDPEWREMSEIVINSVGATGQGTCCRPGGISGFIRWQKGKTILQDQEVPSKVLRGQPHPRCILGIT